MIPKLFSDKFLKRTTELGLTIPQLLGFSKSKLIFYPFITSKGLKDIKNVFKQTKEEDMELIDYYSEYITEEMNVMVKAKQIAQAVNKRLTYKFDLSNYKQAEYWAKPIEVHKKKVDDCDGYSVLITYLLRIFGAKSWEVFTAAGWVIYPNNQLVGHAYTVVLDKDSFLMYPLEGSFYAVRTIKEFGKIPLFLNDRYRGIWWVTNDKISYSRFPILRFIK